MAARRGDVTVRDALDFRGQVVLVTGAGGGIGAAVAQGFGSCGAHVVVHYNSNAEGAEKVAGAVREAGGTASTAPADLTRPAAASDLVDAVVAEHGRLDVLVNNAGDMVLRVPVAEMSDEDYARVLDVNLTSAFATSRRAIPVMQRQGGGAIVNVTSVAARNGGGGRSVVYATAKGAVSTFTRGLAKELARDGIRVNAVAPGIITTPIHDRHTPPELLEQLVGGIPMGRAGTPDECVGAVLFLASPVLSGYVTGQVIEVNGGQLTP
ncbi:SDR family NAD(P)-dependent oxidoreductase [Pseudonocardia nigra]|uniref:SDR family NAD(P)-dependent oxidoreductase n=1 Tax=Pseudonocardia nigra TaxID=1921578 RepID=UPI001C5D2FE2|nr:SDR family NAD(P)-dependent oxidoreductase [Pseudonocardia nigra]